MVKLTLDSLISLGAIPKDTREVNVDKRLITRSEFEKLSDDQKKANERIVILDNSKWVGYSAKKGLTFSCDGSFVAKVTSDGRRLCVQELVDNKLATVDFIELIGKGDQTMADNMNIGNINVTGLMNQIAQETEKEVKPMNTFAESEAAPSAEQSEKEKALNFAKQSISANTSDVEVADSTDLVIFNRKHGELVGYLTQNDRIIKYTTKTVPKTGTDGRKVLVPTADDTIVSAHAQGKAVDKKYYETEIALDAKEAAPGKILGAVIGTPIGGLVAVSEFRKGGRVIFDSTNTTLKYSLFDRDQTNNVLSFYYGGKIKESEKTHGGSAGFLNLKYKFSTKKADADAAQQTLVVPKLEAENRKVVLTPTNYFPVKVYETINVSGNLTQEQCDLLNNSSFIHLFLTSGGKNNAQPKILSLGSKYAERVKKEGDKIVSTYFTTDTNKREPIEVKAFYNKQENLSVLEFPVKKSHPKKEGEGVIWRYETYSCIDKKVEDDADYRNKTSFFSGKFANFIEACGGALTIDAIKETTRKRTTSSKTSTVLDAHTAQALLLKQMQSGLNGVQLEGGKQRMDYQGFSELIASVQA